MSTKTLRKRIALVAVSAVGFGLLTAVQASAGGPITGTQITPIRAGKAASTTILGGPKISITSTTAYTGTNDAVGFQILSAPSSATPAVGTILLGDLSSANLVAGIAKTVDFISASDGTTATSFSTAGTYTARMCLYPLVATYLCISAEATRCSCNYGSAIIGAFRSSHHNGNLHPGT